MAKLKGLGRGLDALLSASDTTDDRLQTLPLDTIRPGKYQPRTRMDEASLDDLAASIRAQGVIQPVVVREVGLGEYELIAGERRWRAARRAGLTEVPAVIRAVADEAALAMALIENIQRQELDPLEEAQGIKRLIDEFGLTHESAAAAVGRSRSAVSNLLRLLALPEPIQQMVHEGRLEMGHARALLPLPAARQMALAEEAVEEGWSVREVERRAQLVPAAVEPRAPKRVDPDVARLAEALAQKLGARVGISHRANGGGRISIDYTSLDELDGLLEKFEVESDK
jgi:ParB family chromosome partitioning protein